MQLFNLQTTFLAPYDQSGAPMYQDIALKTSGLSLLYSKNQGLRNLDLNLPRGEVYGFLGRNGAGKSTSLQILSGVMRPHKGLICFNGETPIMWEIIGKSV